MTHTITRAVVAAGGAGTKMAPITRFIAKEMLPVARKPILEHLIHELSAAGIQDVLFVISSHKTQIPRYFGGGEAYGMDFSYRIQRDGAGPGAPVLAAETWTREQPYVFAFGDNLIRAAADGEPPLRRLVHGNTAQCSVLTCRFSADQIPLHETLLGAADPPSPDPDCPHVVNFGRELLDHTGAPWVHACAARWVLGPFIFEALRACPPRSNGELYLIDAVRRWIDEGNSARAMTLLPSDLRFNCDNWETYADAIATIRA
ncbi:MULTISPECIES: sugar phosphate nucleotidyltransferase [unclassified Streptomyces]|uniref:sugar phosphate nucleotidyltransferase n=1 Tax=unclassified Streptomyces TaxID=2593676 RepID=UPI002E3823F6|nr:sugar phosphate nucleotidyltransferase [Streptomyces sp. NBC_01358]MEE4494975.1 sugar phosphate nucleotidyltransferase [Streptomyces sp. BE230]WSW65723.1 sugar phosphate nucleotidyltransferase [Streptomyces sp. NBC_00995]